MSIFTDRVKAKQHEDKLTIFDGTCVNEIFHQEEKKEPVLYRRFPLENAKDWRSFSRHDCHKFVASAKDVWYLEMFSDGENMFWS